MLILPTRDRRSIFVIPRHRVVYVGTTDTTYEAGRDLWPTITGDDVDYLLAAVNASCDVPPLSRDDVLAAWAGLRPLIAEPGKPPQEISRKEEVRVGPAGVVTIAGGKLTGFRPMAQETLARAAELHDLRLAPEAAARAPLPGGDFDGDLDRLAAGLERAHGLDPETARRLVLCYGAEAGQVAAAGTKPLVPGSLVLASEVDWAVDVEGALRLEDVHYRRTRAALYDPEAREAGLVPSADLMARRLGWSDARREQEIAATRRRLASDLRFQSAEAAA
jgi:glycerol-3-phosphate dehydrogenase